MGIRATNNVNTWLYLCKKNIAYDILEHGIDQMR